MYDEVHFLIVDDDEVCVMAIQRAIKKLRLMNPVSIAVDGINALEILRGENGHDIVEQPFVIMLDLNMPRMDGHEFLREIRSDAKLKNSLVFVLTTSSAREDVEQAYGMNIAGYIVKDNVYSSMITTFQMVDLFSNVIVFPSPDPGVAISDARAV